MAHTITEGELDDYVEQKRQEWAEFAVSGGGIGAVKRLMFCIGQVAPVYRVMFDGRAIYVGTTKETAVREYNNLP